MYHYFWDDVKEQMCDPPVVVRRHKALDMKIYRVMSSKNSYDVCVCVSVSMAE